VIGVLKHQGRLERPLQAAPTGLEQAGDQAQQGALAAAVAAHQHPQARPWDREAAVIESRVAAGPGEAQLVDHQAGAGAGRTGEAGFIHRS
jgi:hypothetical protein